MAQEEAVSRKEKRAQRDAERHQKGKKRKRTEADENGDNAKQDELAVIAQQDNDTGKKSRKRKAEAQVENAVGEDITPAVEGSKPTKRSKTVADETTTPTTTKPAKDSKSRFIVFVGNLPYKTTDSSLRIHFKKLEPFTLRHRTDPQTKKSKGFAFLEFENYDRMKTCLKLYHHSLFDPADPTAGEDPTREETGRKSKKSNARRINVELTAGGGGKTEGRQAKIKAKNVKLEEERKRRAEAERKERMRKEKKEGGGRAKKSEGEGEEGPVEVGAAEQSHGMHPSRLARLNG